MIRRVVYQPVKLPGPRLISFGGCPFPPVQACSNTIDLTAPRLADMTALQLCFGDQFSAGFSQFTIRVGVSQLLTKTPTRAVTL